MSDFASELDLDGLSAVFDNDDWGGILVSNRVVARNELGRFAERVHEANSRATATAGRRGAMKMREIVPKKTRNLAQSVHWHLTGSTKGEISFGRGAPYWRYVAYGAREHKITAWVRFWWEREKRPWALPSDPDQKINHPGIKPHPFIQTVHHYTQLELEDAMRREYALL
jgi:hypothetical protein